MKLVYIYGAESIHIEYGDNDDNDEHDQDEKNGDSNADSDILVYDHDDQTSGVSSA